MISAKRVSYLLLTVLLFIAFSVFFCLSQNLFLDKTIILVLTDFIFLFSFITLLMGKRRKGLIYKSSCYLGIFFVFLICFILTYVSTLLPDMYLPMGIMGMMLVSAIPSEMALGASVYFCIILSQVYGMPNNSFTAYILIAVITVFLGGYSKEKKNKPGHITFLLSIFEGSCVFFITAAFLYMADYSLEKNELMLAIAQGIISAIFMCFVYNLLVGFFTREKERNYTNILNENNPILKDIQAFSKAEYEHAIKVSILSGGCANAIGTDVNAARAGGLYLHGANVERNGSKSAFLKKMHNKCFPLEVIEIIKENTSVSGVISSKESAIVHMTDALLTKFEAIFAKADKSSWNLNMVVYQTLNELSQSGVYDKSGLSMNEFLKIRDFLAQSEMFF